jgi:hypothetical protein
MVPLIIDKASPMIYYYLLDMNLEAESVIYRGEKKSCAYGGQAKKNKSGDGFSQ